MVGGHHINLQPKISTDNFQDICQSWDELENITTTILRFDSDMLTA